MNRATSLSKICFVSHGSNITRKQLSSGIRLLRFLFVLKQRQLLGKTPLMENVQIGGAMRTISNTVPDGRLALSVQGRDPVGALPADKFSALRLLMSAGKMLNTRRPDQTERFIAPACAPEGAVAHEEAVHRGWGNRKAGEFAQILPWVTFRCSDEDCRWRRRKRCS